MASREPVPDISILLVSWNTSTLTRECLDSIPTGIDDATTVETIVVDNGSKDGSVEMLGGRGDLVLLTNERNRGYAAAVNQAYRRSVGGLVLLLNSDVELEPGALSVLRRFLDENPRVAGVGPLYLNPDRTVQQHHYRLPTLATALGGVSRVFERVPSVARSLRRYRMLDDDFSSPRPIPQPSASALLLRRDVLPDHDLLDERFPIYFNDVELAHRLTVAGGELWMTPEAVVLHHHGASTKLLGARLARQHLGAQVRYLELTEPRSRVALFRTVVFLQKTGALLLRRPGALPLRDLVPALRGDPGPLP
jgi:GT2 family glycosyltransferase